MTKNSSSTQWRHSNGGYLPELVVFPPSLGHDQEADLGPCVGSRGCFDPPLIEGGDRGTPTYTKRNETVRDT